MKHLIIVVCLSIFMISCSNDALLGEASEENKVVSIDEAVEDFDCGTNLTYADNLVEAEWIEDANGDITVIINNP